MALEVASLFVLAEGCCCGGGIARGRGRPMLAATLARQCHRASQQLHYSWSRMAIRSARVVSEGDEDENYDEAVSIGIRTNGRFYMEKDPGLDAFEEEEESDQDDAEVMKFTPPDASRKQQQVLRKRSQMLGTDSENQMRTKSPEIQKCGSTQSKNRSLPSSTRAYSSGSEDSRGVYREERRKKKHPSVNNQIILPFPVMKSSPKVGILGGGMSGLMCALTLEERGIPSTVFDTGKHGLGGRMATRNILHKDGTLMAFDHAAQYFTVSNPRFRKYVDKWCSEGAVKRWDGVVGILEGGIFSPLKDSVKYIATNGMRLLAEHMISQRHLISVARPCWITDIAIRGDSWDFLQYNQSHGTFDALVVAHNGKCANRILAQSGSPLAFRQMKSLELSSIFALMAAFDEPLPIPKEMMPFDGAFVKGVNALSWMGNNSSKLSSSKALPECWTFFTTGAFGKRNKVPQESIPNVKVEKVQREVLSGVEVALGLPPQSLPSPSFSKVQLWGAGLPTNTPGVPCIFDAQARVGICGDWLLGSSLESAALSGIALAHQIADFFEEKEIDAEIEEYNVGLSAPMSSLEGHDIGQFPGSSTPTAVQWQRTSPSPSPSPSPSLVT